MLTKRTKYFKIQIQLFEFSWLRLCPDNVSVIQPTLHQLGNPENPDNHLAQIQVHDLFTSPLKRITHLLVIDHVKALDLLVGSHPQSDQRINQL